MFAYNKNYQELQKQPGMTPFNKDSESNSETGSKVKVFTLDFVIKKLIDYGEDQAEARVR